MSPKQLSVQLRQAESPFLTQRRGGCACRLPPRHRWV